MSKGSKSCCCGGCHVIPWDSRLGDELLQPAQQYCCRCIPYGLCISVGEYPDFVTKNAFHDCASFQSDSEPPIFYRASFEINGIQMLLNFRLEVDEYGSCYFTVDGDGIPREYYLINHDVQHEDTYCTDVIPCDQRTEFCCSWNAEWTIDVSAIGSGASTSLTVFTSKTELISTKPGGHCGGKNSACSGCDCICRCVCLSVSPGAGNTIVCAEHNEDGSISWGTEEGYVVSLRGIGDPQLVDSSVEAGTLLSGDALDVLDADRVYHKVGANYGEVDLRYTFDINTAAKARYLKVLAYTVEDVNTVLQAWNWDTSDWDTLATLRSSRDSSHPYVEEPALQPEHTGEGTNEGLVMVRIYSTTALEIGVDLIAIERPNCCKLYLDVPYGVTNETIAPVSLDEPNNCPNPTANWSFFDLNGDPVFVSFACALCDSCQGIISGCCETPIPLVLNATVEIGCPCEPAVGQLISTGGIDPDWSGELDWCTGPISLQLSSGSGPGGYCFQIIGITATACDITVTEQSVECDPFRLVFTGFLTTGLDCCPDDFGSGQAVTITITE